MSACVVCGKQVEAVGGYAVSGEVVCGEQCAIRSFKERLGAGRVPIVVARRELVDRGDPAHVVAVIEQALAAAETNTGAPELVEESVAASGLELGEPTLSVYEQAVKSREAHMPSFDVTDEVVVAAAPAAPVVVEPVVTSWDEHVYDPVQHAIASPEQPFSEEPVKRGRGRPKGSFKIRR